MESNDSNFEVDPDYKQNNTALRKTVEEREENKLTSDKISKIIQEEFDKELSLRQKQLEEIEGSIYRAQKLLHLVRYVLITSYYNKRNLEYKSTEADYNLSPGFDVQNRIHPAVKKLLGNNSTLEILNLRGKRRACDKNSYYNKHSTLQLPRPKKIKLETKENTENLYKFQVVENNQNSLKNRKKTRYRIVVGNISKWMPSLENDSTTHKWMVYVRGLKEAVDISQIIEKVKFYLHPSYKPHDVVEVSNSPFHLSRRGWGEFPLRVQIFFKCPLNKPVSIVHNLKLDKTYTGRQTLGNETIVDLYLHSEGYSEQELEKLNCKNMEMSMANINGCVTKGLNLFPDVKINKQDCEIKTEVDDTLDESFTHISVVKDETDLSTDVKQENDTESASTSCEHNYCHEEIIEEENANVYVPPTNIHSSVFDHSYCLPYNGNTSYSQDAIKNKPDIVSEDQSNTLMFGLGDSYAEGNTKPTECVKKEEGTSLSTDKCIVKTFTTATGQPIRFLPQSFNKLLLNNGNIIQLQLAKQPQSVLKKTNPVSIIQHNLSSQEKSIDYEKYRISLPENRFKSIGEALPYLFKRLPLWNKLANDLDYKCTYPFVATSAEEFSSWNIGKRLSSEWSRAKLIRKMISIERFPDLKNWNTRTFFMYARSHGYSTLPPLGTIFKKHSKELELLMSCFSKSLPQNTTSLKNDVTFDVDVDVTSHGEMKSESMLTADKTDSVDISDKSLKYHCTFVKEAALDCGIILKSEEISEGVTMNAAERMIFEAIRCFAENLIRRSRLHLVCQENYSEEASEITTEEIKIALNERPEIRSIINFQKRKREMDFFL